MLLGMDLSMSKCGVSGPDICQNPTTFTPLATFTNVWNGHQTLCGSETVYAQQRATCATDAGNYDLARVAATCCSDG